MFRPGQSAGAERVVRVQAGLSILFALIAFFVADAAAAAAVAYGVGIALASTALLAWREAQSRRHPEWDQHRLMKLFIRVGLERLVLLVGLLALGFGVLKLAPLALLLGLVGAQFAWVAVTRAG